MISVVCWRWKPREGYRSTYPPETVNVLRRMVARHYRSDHRFICVTDDPSGLDPGIDVVPLWNDFADVPNPHGAKNPSCYRRLRAFHPDIGTVFGDRFVSLDLDTVIAGDLAPLFDRPEDFVIYGDTNKKTPYNGSLFLLRAGARPQVWTQFDPRLSPKQSMAAGCWGSDQGWISLCLGPKEARYSRRDGVYSFRNELQSVRGGKDLGKDVRVVVFHGRLDPWNTYVQSQYPWVRAHWQ